MTCFQDFPKSNHRGNQISTKLPEREKQKGPQDGCLSSVELIKNTSQSTLSKSHQAFNIGSQKGKQESFRIPTNAMGPFRNPILFPSYRADSIVSGLNSTRNG